MKTSESRWNIRLTDLYLKHPWFMIAFSIILTVIAAFLAENLEMRVNFKDLLPEDNPVVQSYQEVQDRFGDASSLVVALEGEYPRIIAMAEVLEPLLKDAGTLYNIQGRIPTDYIRKHGFSLLKPNQFDRVLTTYADPSLIGTLRGLNDDYEREYVDNESNMKRDEVDIARSFLGLHRALEILDANLSGSGTNATTEEAVDALTLGEPWIISLDRKMLLIACQPKCKPTDIDSLLETATEAEAILQKIRPDFPDVRADLTGLTRISQDEMNSIGLYTKLLSLAAIILIYLLLARSFRGWVMPIFALLPLIVGIIWTMGFLYILFGGLNLFSAMIMLVLLGLGIDFSIHLISRFNEERTSGKSLRKALEIMLGGTGTAVITGGLTSAAAFLTLLIGRTRGVYEFGFAAGFGVLFTLLAIFFLIPPLLVIRTRVKDKRPGKNRTVEPEKHDELQRINALPLLGVIARSGWRHPAIYLVLTVALMIGSIWGMKHIDFEYDFLNLEPKGLRSVELQREIPKRFGMSDHAAWVVAESIEESRQLKESFKTKPLVGDVSAISDFIPSAERLNQYTPHLEEFRQALGNWKPTSWQKGDETLLLNEIERLLINLDFMTNLAYGSGLDRITGVADRITGIMIVTSKDPVSGEVTESVRVDSSSVLRRLMHKLQGGIELDKGIQIANTWAGRMQSNLISMSDPSPVSIDDLPESIRLNYLPRTGDGYLVQVIPRRYLWSREDLDRFAEQTSSVSTQVAGTEQLMMVMFEEILADGKRAAIFALVVISFLVLIHFRSALGLLALVPLAAGALTMVGIMFAVGMKYNFMNLIAVPIILGIGIDDGIHVLHRFRKDRVRTDDALANVYSLVGRAILLTSLTTMIGFGSIAFYTMRGMASFGQVLFMGVGACFLTTLLVLPAVLRIFTKKESPVSK